MSKPLHIGIAAPIATEHVAELLTNNGEGLPKGYGGAPFTGVLIAELLKQGFQVSAFTTDTTLPIPSAPLHATGENFDFYICPERPRAWRFNQGYLGRAIDAFAYERKLLAETILRSKPDIIHAHWSYEFALAAIKTKLPHLITCHDAPAVILKFNPYPYRAMRYLMARQVFRKAKNLTTVSDYMVQQIGLYTSKPIDVVPNPLANFVLGMGHIRSASESRKIGFICNGWEARKNPQPALQAFAQFKTSEPAAELHLYGHDFGKNEMAEQWCQQQGIAAGMFFHGATPHKQLITELDNLDLLLHTSLEESFGVVIAEAMALGLPLVAGRHSGAVPWVVGYDEQPDTNYCCGVLCDVSQASTVFASIETAFNGNYAERSAAGYLRARKMFTPEAITSEYLRLYKNICP